MDFYCKKLIKTNKEFFCWEKNISYAKKQNVDNHSTATSAAIATPPPVVGGRYMALIQPAFTIRKLSSRQRITANISLPAILTRKMSNIRGGDLRKLFDSGYENSQQFFQQILRNLKISPTRKHCHFPG